MIRKTINLLFLLLPVMVLGQSPGGVSGNLQLWLSAESYTGGTVWSDVSPNARHATKIGTVLNTSLYNFYNVPTGLTNANYFSVPHNTALDADNGAISVFAVGLPGNGTSSPFIAKTSNSAWDAGWILSASDPVTDVGFTTGNWSGVGTTNVAKQTGFSSSVPYLVSAFGNGAATNVVSISNNASTETTNTSTKTTSATALTIGYDRYAATQGFKGGNIAEVMVFNRNLSVAEKARVQSYLAFKYGITLSQTVPQSYIASDGVTKMWDHTAVAASTYQNNIFGIGQDNGSSIHQKQSKSINADQKLIIGAGASLADTNATNANSLSNGQFLMVGDNGLKQSLAIPLSNLLAPGGETNYRFESIWKVQNTAGTGQVIVAWPKRISNLHLVRSAGNDSFDALDTFIPMTNEVTINGIVYNTATVTFTDGDYFTFAGYLHAPGGVVNALSYWYRADKSAANTGVGADVTSWTDFFSGAVSSQLGTNAMPKYAEGSTNYFNFNPGINFTAATQTLGNTNVRTFLATSYDVFTFTKEGMDNGGLGHPSIFRSLVDNALPTGNIRRWDGLGILMDNRIERYSDQFGGVYYNTPAGAFSTTIPSIMHHNFTPTTITKGLNGNVSTTTTHTQIGTLNGGHVFGDSQFGGNGSDNRGFIGHVGETIIYGAGNLTATERRRVDSYLAIKYGITLDRVATEHYLGSAGGIVWNGTDNSGYNNNIFGITHDELSALHQKQSKSVNANQKLIIGAGSSLANTNVANTNSLTAGQFLIVGDNNLAQSLTTPLVHVAPGGDVNNRFASIWKVQNTGSTGQVIVAWPKGISNLHLVRSTDGDTFTASDSFIPMSAEITINGVVYNTATATFNNGDYFTLAGFVTAPGGVAGTDFWVKSDDAGTIATAWKDHSINADDIPAVGTWSLSSADRAHNFHPYTTGYSSSKLFYNNNNSALHSNTGLGTPSNHSIFTSVRPTSVTEGRIVGIDDDTNAAEPAMSITSSGLPNHYEWSNTTTNTSFTNPYITGSVNIFSAVANNAVGFGDGTSTSSGGEKRLGLNGDYQSTTFTGTNRFQLLGRRLRIGHSGFTHGGAFSGDIMEIVWYNRLLTPNEQSRVNTYLAIKNGVTLAEDYLASNNDIIWNRTANIGYNTNVFGLARDNSSGLHQKQAASTESSQKLVIGHSANLFESNEANTNSLTNGQFLIVGDNGLAQMLNTPLAHTAPGGETNFRFSSIWKVQNTGTVGQVIVAWPKGISNLHLVHSVGDDTFDGTDAFVPMNNEVTINGVVYNTATATFASGDYFTFAGYANAPGGVVGQTVWLRADKDVTVAAGNKVDAWTNQGLSGGNAVPAYPANGKPNFVELSHNFNPVVMDNTTAHDGLVLPNVFANTLQRALSSFVVQSQPTITQEVTMISYGNNVVPSSSTDDPWFASNNATRLNIFWQSNGGGSNQTYPNSLTRLNNIQTINSYFIPQYVGTSNTSLVNMVGMNGSRTSFNRNGNANSVMGNHLFVHQDGGNNNTSNSSISEVISYDKALTVDEQNRIDSYLAIKYGITLYNPGGTATPNYLGSASNIVWNASANAIYNRNIFGLARADIANFAQKVSKSVNAGTILTVAKNNDFVSSNSDADRTNLSSDESYLLFGDNNDVSPTLVTPTEIGDCGELLGSETDIKLIARKWLMQRTNNVGVTYLDANLAAYASTLNSDVYMFVADDANFTQNVKMIAGTKTGNNWTFAHNFDNENAVRYITFGGTYVAAPCEQCKGETYTLRTGYQWNQGLWANQTSNQKLNISLGNDANGIPLTASMYADYSENPSIEYVPTRYPQQYGGKWTMVRRYDNTTAKDRHRIVLSQAMKASFQLSNINTYLNNKNNFEVIGYCNGSVVMPRITFAYNTSYHTFEITGNQAKGNMSWRGFVPNVSTANVRFDRPVDEIVIISAVERVNNRKTLRSSLYGDITLECAEVLEPNPDNVYVSHSFTQNTLATCGGETTMRIKVTNNNLCEDKTISLHQLLPAGLSYIPGSFNGNDLPAGTMAAATLAYSGNSLELSGLTLPRGEHWMYVDVANPGTAGTYPTQFTFEVTDGLDPAHTYSSSVKDLNYYNSTGSTPAAPSLELSIKDNVSCAENDDVITYRMKIDNPNVGGITGAEILHMFDYDQTIQSVVFVSGEDEDGVITGSYPIDGSATPITPVGSSLFNLIDAVIPQGVSYIDITVNVGDSYDIAEVQALGISSSFLVGFGNGECAESGESISNEVNLQLCNACVKPGATGIPLGSSAGIRTKNDNSVVNWPVSVPNGYLVLDGAFKGMVITHMTTAQINALTPLKGMLVYDTDEQCVKLYRGAGANAPLVNPTRQGWVCIQRICVD